MQAFSLQDALQQPLAVTQLHLDRSGLEEVPDTILHCPNLRVLNLQDNQLVDLPDWLSQLTQLESLDVSGNRLQKWTADWSSWKWLKTLNFSNNQLTTVRGARFPVNLQNLDLSHNRLRTLSVTSLPTSLIRLELAHNSLKQLPDLRANLKLRQLDIRKNLIADWPALPVSTGLMEGLQSLSMAQNRLRKIPGRIAECQSLRELDLASNQLQALPDEIKQLKWLVRLSLEQNELTRIPPAVAQLTLLDALFLAGNQIKSNINLTANSQLRRLDLSKNPIQQISGLPVSLRHLSLKGINLQDWTFLRKLAQLETLELTKTESEDLLQSVCHLAQLTTLRGLLPYGKKEKLLQLLKEPFLADEKRELLDFWIFGKTEQLDVLLLQKALNTDIPALQKLARRYLLDRNKDSNIPPDTKAIHLLGRLQTSANQLNSLFAAKAIKNTSAARIAILGRAPYTNIPFDQVYEWYSEAQLLVFLRKQDRPASSWTGKELNKLKKRLLHPNPSQVKLALLLLEKEILPTQLLPALILAGKLQEEPALKRKLLALARQYCPPEYEILLQTPLQFKNQTAQQSAIRHWGERSQLPADQLADLLNLL